MNAIASSEVTEAHYVAFNNEVGGGYENIMYNVATCNDVVHKHVLRLRVRDDYWKGFG